MWSTSPAERTVSVPPFVEHDVGVGGGAVETFPLPPDDVVPFVPDADLLLAPQPAATAARPSATSAIRIAFIAPPLEAWLISSPRVERVANAVAKEVEGQNGEDERCPGEDEVPPGGAEDRRCLGNHLAPARLGRVDADAEVRERRLQQDVLRDDERRVDDDRRDEVGQDLAEEDRAVGGPRRTRRLDELLLADGEDLAAAIPSASNRTGKASIMSTKREIAVSTKPR